MTTRPARGHSPRIAAASPLRRRLLTLLVAALAVVGSVVGSPAGVAAAAVAPAPVSATPAVVAALDCHDVRPAPGPDPLVCADPDEAPPGVDVHAPVSTADLVARPGAMASPFATLAGDTSVPCDGDGTSGYRVEGLYVRESSSPDRFPALEASFQRWAAGANQVFVNSAAKTGGVRNLRYVTTGSGGTCAAKITAVTVPDGSLASLWTEIDALSALGYSRTDRKYLMWTDAAVYCGIANRYIDNTPGQANINNGKYATYARVDPQCWGLAQHSTEAHELVHTMGGVDSSAPHGTSNGHCWDEWDTMCYNDGGAAMVTVCPPTEEALLDCNNDDYFSTFPDPGSWLSKHWNIASSRTLIGGGNGSTSSGTPGNRRSVIYYVPPVNPGLPQQVPLYVTAPAGHPYTVSWSTTSDSCAASASPGARDTGQITCDAVSAAVAAQVTATVTDTVDGTVTTASAALTPSTEQRPASISLTVSGQVAPTTVPVCAGTSLRATVTVTDDGTGLPVRGASVTLSTGTRVFTTATGSASATVPAFTKPLTASLNPGPALFPGFTPITSAAATPAPSCGQATSTATLSTPTAAPGDTVTVTGRVTGRNGAALAAQPVLLTYPTPSGPAQVNGTSDGTGRFTLSFPAAATGDVTLEVAPTTASAYTPPDGIRLPLTVTQLTSTLTVTAPDSVATGAPLVLTGVLVGTGDGVGVAGAPVTGTVSVGTQVPQTWSAVTDTAGRYAVTVATTGVPTGTATVTATSPGTARYAGSDAAPATTVVTVPSPETPATTLTLTTPPAPYGGSLSVTGTLRTDAGQPLPRATVRLLLYVGPAAVAYRDVVTTSTGAYSATFPGLFEAGAVEATYDGSAATGPSAARAVFTLTAAPTVTTVTATPGITPQDPVTVSGTVRYRDGAVAGSPVFGVPVTLTYTTAGAGGAPSVTTWTGTTAADGTYTTTLPGPVKGALVVDSDATDTALASTVTSVVDFTTSSTRATLTPGVTTRVGTGPVTLTGVLTTALGASVSPYAGVLVTVTQRSGTIVRTLGTVTTDAEGRYSLTVTLSSTSLLTATVAADSQHHAASATTSVRVTFAVRLGPGSIVIRSPRHR